MRIDVEGYALRVLADFIHYASEYPDRIAAAMWYYEDSFSYGVRRLKDAYDKALSEEARRW